MPAALSVSFSDVYDAYTAAAPGETITIPAGTADWAGNSITVSKDVIFQGAGKTQTIIQKSSWYALLWANNTRARVFDLAIEHSTSSTDSTAAACLSIRGAGNVIGRCKFTGTTTKMTGIFVSGGTSNPHPTGVIHDCDFVAARIHIQGDRSNSTNQQFGRRIWANADQTAEPGTENTIFIEDCTLDKHINIGQNMVDAEYGGHYVIRYCTLIDAVIFGHGASSSGERGTKFIEAYENEFVRDDIVPTDAPIWLRSGRLIAYNNTVTGTYNSSATILLSCEIQRYGDNADDGNEAVTNGTGTHTGSGNAAVLTDSGKSWTTNAFVGYTVYNLTDGSKGAITANTATTVTATLAGGTDNDWDASDSYKITDGYPLRDQPGTGTDTALWLGSATAPAQAKTPSYQWGNTRNGSPVVFDIGLAGGGASLTTWVKADRDYFNSGPPGGYTAYTYPHPLRGSLAAPSFLTQPSGQIVTEGDTATFSVVASGNPSPTYQWRKGGSNISGATGASLTITNAQEADEGTYTCVATNSEGSATSSGATLTVNAGEPPPDPPPSGTASPLGNRSTRFAFAWGF